MMEPWFAEARRKFHADCLSGPISETNGIPSIADVGNGTSRAISVALVRQLGQSTELALKPAGQSAGSLFENVCLSFIQQALGRVSHIRPGTFSVLKGRSIALFDQYSHLDDLRLLAEASRELKTHLGSDYLIKPDIVVVREPEDDAEINRLGLLVVRPEQHSSH